MLCLLTTTLGNGFVFGQQSELDSISGLLNSNTSEDTTRVDLLNDLSKLYKRSNLDSAKSVANQSIELATRLDYKSGEALAHYRLGNALLYLRDGVGSIAAYKNSIAIWQEIDGFAGEARSREALADVYTAMHKPDEAVAEMDTACTLHLQVGDSVRLVGALNNSGKLCSEIAKWDEAYERLMRAKTMLKSMDQQVQIEGIVLTNLATLFLKTEDYERAMSEAMEALEKFREIDFTLGLGTIEGIIANIYKSQKDYDQALIHYEKAIKYAEESGDKVGLANRLHNLGALYFDLGQDDLSFSYLRRAEKLSKNTRNTLLQAKGLGSLGTLYYRAGNVDSAIYCGLKSAEIYEKLGYPNSSLHSNNLLSVAFATNEDYEKALFHEKRARQIEDSIAHSEKMHAIHELEIQYKTEQRKKEVETLSIENELYEGNIREFKIILWTTITIFILTAFLIIIYIRSRRTRTARLAAELEQKALRAQMNPHFIFNCLNSIQRLYIEEKIDKAADYMADFSHLLRAILENSSKATISLEEELKYLDLYCKMEQLRTDGLFTYKIDQSPEIDAKYFRITPLIIQPFVENAIWHGILPKKAPGTIEISIKQLNDNLAEIKVKDDGVGWKNENKGEHNSKGIELIEARINTKVNITHLSQGTEVSFTIKTR